MLNLLIYAAIAVGGLYVLGKFTKKSAGSFPWSPVKYDSNDGSFLPIAVTIAVITAIAFYAFRRR